MELRSPARSRSTISTPSTAPSFRRIFAASRYFKRDQTINFSNANGTYSRQSRDRRIEAKLTGALSQRHNVILSITDAPTNGTNDCQIGCLDMTSVDPDIQNPLRSQTVFYNGILKSNFLVE